MKRCSAHNLSFFTYRVPGNKGTAAGFCVSSF